MRRGLNYKTICNICNKDFMIEKYRLKRARYCSMKCYGISKLGCSPSNKNRPRLDMLGNKHWNWIKDRTKVKRQNRRDNPLYKKWRIQVLKRDNYRCFDCGEIKKGQMEADHIYSFARYPRLRYVLENGQTLCKDCHKIKTKMSLAITYL